MKMKPMHLAALAAAAGLGFFLVRDEKHTLVKGGRYQLTVELKGSQGANWSGIAEKLEEMGLSDFEMTGSGDTRKVVYTIAPTGPVQMQEGMPLYQITSGDSYAQAILKDVKALGRA